MSLLLLFAPIHGQRMILMVLIATEKILQRNISVSKKTQQLISFSPSVRIDKDKFIIFQIQFLPVS
jgi:hypothetical protein